MLSADESIDELPLSHRLRKALRMVGVTTVDDFLFRDLSDVLLSPGCWRKTYVALCSLQERLRKDLAHHEGVVSRTEEFLLSNVEPLIDDPRCRTVLKNLGVVTVGDFLAVEVENTPHMPGCGKITRRNLLDAQTMLRRKAQAAFHRGGGPGMESEVSNGAMLLFPTLIDASHRSGLPSF